MSYFYGYYMPNYNAMNQDSQLTWSEIVDKNFNMTNEVTIQSPREFNNNERKRVEEKKREFVNLQ